MEIQAITVELTKLQLGENDRLIVKLKSNITQEERDEIIRVFQESLDIRQPIILITDELDISVLNVSQP